MPDKLYEERLELIRKAVRLEPVDKIPFAPCGSAVWARLAGIPMKDYLGDFDLACTTNLKFMEEFGADVTQCSVFSPYTLPDQWLSRISMPGIELGDDDLWQVNEAELMKFEDYQDLLSMGWNAFHDKFMKERIDNNDAKLAPFLAYAPIAEKRHAEAGYPVINSFLLITPFEFLCGGRSLECFFMDDLMDEPDLIDEVFKAIMKDTLPKYRAMMEAMKPIGCWIGGWRAAPSMMSLDMWERFEWPHFKAYCELCVEMDVIPILHLDANWDRALPYFRQLPPKKCILALDSKTDIRLAKKTLGDMMCILGDVPAEVLAFGTYDEAYAHTKKLIDDIGPTGYIVASGCDIPANARRECVQAMADATNNYFKK